MGLGFLTRYCRFEIALDLKRTCNGVSAAIIGLLLRAMHTVSWAKPCSQPMYSMRTMVAYALSYHNKYFDQVHNRRLNSDLVHETLYCFRSPNDFSN